MGFGGAKFDQNALNQRPPRPPPIRNTAPKPDVEEWKQKLSGSKFLEGKFDERPNIEANVFCRNDLPPNTRVHGKTSATQGFTCDFIESRLNISLDDEGNFRTAFLG